MPGAPVQPGVISGSSVICPNLANQTYSIESVPNATTYVWSIPSGWTLTGGAGTTAIQVTTGAAGQRGNISVTANNSCGTSETRTLAVEVTSIPDRPGIISGTSDQCPNQADQIYSIGSVQGATLYNWTVPTG